MFLKLLTNSLHYFWGLNGRFLYVTNCLRTKCNYGIPMLLPGVVFSPHKKGQVGHGGGRAGGGWSWLLSGYCAITYSISR